MVLLNNIIISNNENNNIMKTCNIIEFTLINNY